MFCIRVETIKERGVGGVGVVTMVLAGVHGSGLGGIMIPERRSWHDIQLPSQHQRGLVMKYLKLVDHGFTKSVE